MKSYIFITTSFDGLHHWPHAEPPVEFLAHSHRHVFKVRAEMSVVHEDRDIEFIWLKHQLDDFLEADFPRLVNPKQQARKDYGSTSCETMAITIASWLNQQHPRRVVSVEVSEDGENGAIVRMA